MRRTIRTKGSVGANKMVSIFVVPVNWVFAWILAERGWLACCDVSGQGGGGRKLSSESLLDSTLS